MKYLLILSLMLLVACEKKPDLSKIITEDQMTRQKKALVEKIGDNKFTQSFHEYIMKNTSFKVIETNSEMTEVKVEKMGTHPEALARILLEVNKDNFDNDISYFIGLADKKANKENFKPIAKYVPFPHPGTCKIKKEGETYKVVKCEFKQLRMDKNGNVIIVN